MRHLVASANSQSHRAGPFSLCLWGTVISGGVVEESRFRAAPGSLYSDCALHVERDKSFVCQMISVCLLRLALMGHTI